MANKYAGTRIEMKLLVAFVGGSPSIATVVKEVRKLQISLQRMIIK